MAADFVNHTGASGADAHIGARVRSLAGDQVMVPTSNPDDMIRVSTP